MIGLQPNPQPPLAGPPDAIRAALARHLPGVDGATVHRLPQGRSNLVYRLETGAGSVVCKIYDPAAATPLFANRPADEAAVLKRLSGTGLAPRHLASDPAGSPPWLAYGWIDPGEAPSPGAVGQALCRLHALSPPGDLPEITVAGALSQARALVAELPSREAQRLGALQPASPQVSPVRPVLLHGDPVPGNVLGRRDGSVCLIDWQCPGTGDPLFDIALYLSPAMQIVHAGCDLDAAGRQAFWTAYGDRHRTRYDRLAPFFHWRMALYCAWRVAQGDAAYAPGLSAELGALERS